MKKPSGASRRWIMPLPIADESAKALADAVGLPEPVCRVLIRRGVETPAEARTFLRPHLSGVHSPFDLPDMLPAVARV
jgi:single-stranded-DNA-specific exonuclease